MKCCLYAEDNCVSLKEKETLLDCNTYIMTGFTWIYVQSDAKPNMYSLQYSAICTTLLKPKLLLCQNLNIEQNSNYISRQEIHSIHIHSAKKFGFYAVFVSIALLHCDLLTVTAAILKKLVLGAQLLTSALLFPYLFVTTQKRQRKTI